MKWALPLLSVLLCVYLLAFPVRLRPEQELKPVWAVDVGRDPVARPSGETEGTRVPFVLGDRFGYLGSQGDLLLQSQKIHGIAIDSDRFINYSSVSGNLVVQNSSGDVTDTVEVRGYPILIDGRLLLISTNRAELAEITDAGEIAWKREYAAVITDLDSQNNVLVVGLLDSRAELLDFNGDVTLELDLMGSRINAVYGCALSSAASLLAVVHGIDPQYITIMDLREDGTDPTKVVLRNEFRTTRYLRFLNEDEYLLVEDVNGVVVLDINRGETHRLELAGSVLEAGELEGEDLVWVVSQADERTELLVVHLPDNVVFRVPYASDEAFAAGADNKLYLGVDRHIGMIERVER
jgi:hypothetical protein